MSFLSDFIKGKILVLTRFPIIFRNIADGLEQWDAVNFGQVFGNSKFNFHVVTRSVDGFADGGGYNSFGVFQPRAELSKGVTGCYLFLDRHSYKGEVTVEVSGPDEADLSPSVPRTITVGSGTSVVYLPFTFSDHTDNKTVFVTATAGNTTVTRILTFTGGGKPPASGSSSGSGVAAEMTVTSAVQWLWDSITPLADGTYDVVGTVSGVVIDGVPGTHTLTGTMNISNLSGAWVMTEKTTVLNDFFPVTSMNISFSSDLDPKTEIGGLYTGFTGSFDV